jgi:hypothetical protein
VFISFRVHVYGNREVNPKDLLLSVELMNKVWLSFNGKPSQTLKNSMVGSSQLEKYFLAYVQISSLSSWLCEMRNCD